MSFDAPDQELQHFRSRLLVAGSFMLLCFAVLVARFGWLQINRFDYYHTRAEDNRIALVPISPNRGLIVDRDGEVLARGNHIMGGYWEQPDATADAIHPASDAPDGPSWFHTGDGGFLDEDYYITISDRKKDVIISGGENVSSIEVEDVIFSHPEIAEVAVIGVPDEKWGELVMALVVATPGSNLSEQDVIDYARSKLAHYKCPKRVEFRDVLARTATGKLQKFKLREPYWTGRDRLVN